VVAGKISKQQKLMKNKKDVVGGCNFLNMSTDTFDHYDHSFNDVHLCFVFRDLTLLVSELVPPLLILILSVIYTVILLFLY